MLNKQHNKEPSVKLVISQVRSAKLHPARNSIPPQTSQSGNFRPITLTIIANLPWCYPSTESYTPNYQIPTLATSFKWFLFYRVKFTDSSWEERRENKTRVFTCRGVRYNHWSQKGEEEGKEESLPIFIRAKRARKPRLIFVLICLKPSYY